jgi:hypothetical protein
MSRVDRNPVTASHTNLQCQPSKVEAVARYIARQKEHHRRRSFQEKLILFLRRHGVEYDQRYI